MPYKMSCSLTTAVSSPDIASTVSRIECAGDDHCRPAGIQAGHALALFERHRREVLAQIREVPA